MQLANYLMKKDQDGAANRRSQVKDQVMDSEVEDYNAASSRLNLALNAQKSIISEMPRTKADQPPYLLNAAKPPLGASTAQKALRRTD